MGIGQLEWKFNPWAWGNENSSQTRVRCCVRYSSRLRLRCIYVYPSISISRADLTRPPWIDMKTRKIKRKRRNLPFSYALSILFVIFLSNYLWILIILLLKKMRIRAHNQIFLKKLILIFYVQNILD